MSSASSSSSTRPAAARAVPQSDTVLVAHFERKGSNESTKLGEIIAACDELDCITSGVPDINLTAFLTDDRHATIDAECRSACVLHVLDVTGLDFSAYTDVPGAADRYLFYSVENGRLTYNTTWVGGIDKIEKLLLSAIEQVVREWAAAVRTRADLVQIKQKMQAASTTRAEDVLDRITKDGQAARRKPKTIRFALPNYVGSAKAAEPYLDSRDLGKAVPAGMNEVTKLGQDADVTINVILDYMMDSADYLWFNPPALGAWLCVYQTSPPTMEQTKGMTVVSLNEFRREPAVHVARCIQRIHLNAACVVPSDARGMSSIANSLVQATKTLKLTAAQVLGAATTPVPARK